MDREDLIDKIRKLSRCETAEDMELAEILVSHGCYAMLRQIPSWKMQATVMQAVNYQVLKKRYEFCEAVFEELVNIPHAVIKGAVLSDRIFGNPAYRKSGDIDLLISPQYNEEVETILKRYGFVQGRLVANKIVPYTRQERIYQRMYSHQAPSFIKLTDDSMCPFINVDVNLDIYWGESTTQVDMEEFLCHTENRKVFGVDVQTLCPVYECISLCMHHYKDFNSLYLLSGGEISLSLFTDLYGYFTVVRPDAVELKQVCDRLGVTGYISFCIWHTEQIFHSKILRRYLDMIPPVKDMLYRIGLSETEYKILDGGVSGALFDADFSDRLKAMLTEQDRKKIEINKMYM